MLVRVCGTWELEQDVPCFRSIFWIILATNHCCRQLFASCRKTILESCRSGTEAAKIADWSQAAAVYFIPFSGFPIFCRNLCRRAHDKFSEPAERTSVYSGFFGLVLLQTTVKMFLSITTWNTCICWISTHPIYHIFSSQMETSDTSCGSYHW